MSVQYNNDDTRILQLACVYSAFVDLFMCGVLLLARSRTQSSAMLAPKNAIEAAHSCR